MNNLETTTMLIDDIEGLPDDMERRMTTKPVKLIAESLPRVGLLERIKVRLLDHRIVSGRDRVAAHLLNKETEIEVQLVECTDAELLESDLVSNAARRHSSRERDEAIVALVDIYTQEEAAAPPDDPHPSPGRPTTPKGRAQARVAKATGKQIQDVRRAGTRHEKRTAPTVVKPKQAKRKDAVITLGQPLDESFLAQCEAVARFTSDSVSAVQKAQKCITQLLNAEIECYVGDLERVRTQLHNLSAELKGLKPHSVCPYCKAVQGFVEHCDACEGKGWVGSRGYDAVPSDLLVTGEAATIVDSNGDSWGVEEAVAEGEGWMPDE